jgi:ubiquinone/menaquinone biosynthesis C-methylase UbiE
MPYPSESFDYVVCQAAFKNFPDPVAALDEIQRVLRPGAKASILDPPRCAASPEPTAPPWLSRHRRVSPLSAIPASCFP